MEHLIIIILFLDYAIHFTLFSIKLEYLTVSVFDKKNSDLLLPGKAQKR